LFFSTLGLSDVADECEGPLVVIGLLVESERASLFSAALACGRSNPADELDAPDLATEDGAESRRFLRVLTTSALWPNAADELVESVFVTGLMLSFSSNGL
jgi:hypothetical protein